MSQRLLRGLQANDIVSDNVDTIVETEGEFDVLLLAGSILAVTI